MLKKLIALFRRPAITRNQIHATGSSRDQPQKAAR